MSWESTKLSEFLSERDGRIKYETANKLGLQRIKKIDFSGNIHLSQETDSKTDMIRVKSGDLVISGINAAKGAIAVHTEEDDVLATIHYSAYEFNSDRISVDFLKWFFKSPEFTDLLREQIPGGIKTELKPKHILPLEVKLPKLAEQLSISERLNGFHLKQLELEHEITHQQSLLTKLKQAILQEAIQGKLTADWRAANPDTEPASELLKRIQAKKAKLIAAKKLKKEKLLPPIEPEEITFDIPEGWEWCRLGNILNFSSGDGLTAAQMAGGEVPVFGGNGINGYHNKANIETETVVVGRVGANCGAVHKTPARAWVTDNAFITTFFESCLTMDFLVLLLRFLDLNHLSYDGSQPVISGKRVYPLPTPLPPFAEQAAIVERVDALMENCRELESEIESSRTHADQLLQAVLKEAFSPAS
jgi:type I restriction enzyme S subunit